ncbi:MAG: class I SAM-dependent methyltransferase [Myxococcota bacterium]
MDTYERSCAHWSESGRDEMESFYALASVDYRYLAESRDWAAWLGHHQIRVGSGHLRLLDVACGSGKFPAALLKYVSGMEQVGEVCYDLLDPSAFSIEETRRVLRSPFVAENDMAIPLQRLSAVEAYDVAWATHALYAVPVAELDGALARLLRAMRPGGEIFIAHGHRDGHYVDFYRRFLEAFRDGRGTPYCAVEDIVASIERLGAPYEVRTLEYENGVAESARDTVEGYLQRCVFDDSLSLDALVDHPITGSYLAGCRQEGQWRFAQRVGLVTVRV